MRRRDAIRMLSAGAAGGWRCFRSLLSRLSAGAAKGDERACTGEDP
jgi:hypothetical protein